MTIKTPKHVLHAKNAEFFHLMPRLTGTNLRRSCKGCYYRRALASGRYAYTVCHYMLETGERRGCPPEQCTKKVTLEQMKKQRAKEARTNGREQKPHGSSARKRSKRSGEAGTAGK